MIVIADTGPLNYLVQLNLEHLLPSAYGRIVVPRAVLNELSHPRAPLQVRNWAFTPPAWLHLVEVQRIDGSLPASLGLGEREAISLATDLHPDFLAGQLDLPATIHDLLRLGFRARADLIASLLGLP